MKRILAFVLSLLMVLPLCACGGEDKGVEVTLDNYSEYLEVKVFIEPPDWGAPFEKGEEDDVLNVRSINNGKGISLPGLNCTTLYVYKCVHPFVNVAAVSQDYNFKDLTVTVKINGTYQTVGQNSNWEWIEAGMIDMPITVKCDTAGKGYSRMSIYPNNYPDNDGYMHEKMMDYDWEIVEITGTVVPAKA